MKKEMDLFEELELPPWEKFLRYGLFPFKMVLNITLTVLITVVVILINISFANYSRSIWLSAANILFPPDYTNYQTDLLTPYQYYIYTQNRTIVDSNRLVINYFDLPDLTVNDVDIYKNTEETNGLDAPTILVELTTGTVRYTLSDGVNSYWPLSYNNINSINTRQFFDDFKQMIFHFYLKSYGNSDDYSYQKNLCFIWEWKITYNFNSNGQILVTSDSSVLNRCEKLPETSTIYSLSIAILLFAIFYQLLLFKAVARQLIILYNIKQSLDIIEQEFIGREGGAGGRKSRRSSVSSSASLPRRRASQDSISGQDLRESITSLLANQQGIDKDKDSDHSDVDDDRDEVEEDDDGNTELTKLIRHRLTEANLNSKSRPSSHSTGNPLTSRKSSVNPPRNASMDSRSSEQSHMSMLEENIVLLKEAITSLTWEDVFIIINLWFLVATIGNLFAFVYSIRIFGYGEDTIATPFLKGGLGVACLMYWFSLVQYLEFFPRYYIMISMLKITAPRVSQFLLGVLPIFIGYALLGMICFGDIADRFGDLTQTLRTLFSVVNGDIIFDTFHAIDVAGIGGQLYIYIYILIFTYVVLMTIIAIVEEAFFESQEKKGITNSTIDPPTVLGNAAVAGDDNDDRQKSHSTSRGRSGSGVGVGLASTDLGQGNTRNISSQKNTAIDNYLKSQIQKRRRQRKEGERNRRHSPDSESSASSSSSSEDGSEGDDGLIKVDNTANDYIQNHPRSPDGSMSFHSYRTADTSSSKTGAKERRKSSSRTSSRDQIPSNNLMKASLSMNNLQAVSSSSKPAVVIAPVNIAATNAPVGRRDVPDHLKVLLQNVEKRSSGKPLTGNSNNNNAPSSGPTLRRTLTNPAVDDTGGGYFPFLKTKSSTGISGPSDGSNKGNTSGGVGKSGSKK